MFTTLAAGYGSVAVLSLAGAALTGGGALSWVLFAWLAGAMLTLMVGSLIGPLLEPTDRPKHMWITR
jgi:hypothetical protein